MHLVLGLTLGWLEGRTRAAETTSTRVLLSSDCAHGIYLNGLGAAWTGFCSCETDWTGPTCAIPLCYNGGRPNVLPTAGKIGCECLRRFFGTHCQLPLCDGGYVENGKCACFHGFHGAFCQHRCLHGRWTEKGCICRKGFKPPDCAECLPSRLGPACEEPGLWRRLAFSGIVLAALSTLAAALLCCVWQNTRRASAPSSPTSVLGPSAPLLPPPSLRPVRASTAHASQLPGPILRPPPSYQPHDPAPLLASPRLPSTSKG